MFSSIFSGYTFGIVTPSRIGEAPGRAINMEKSKVLKTSLAVFYEKLLTLFVMLVIGGVAFTLYVAKLKDTELYQQLPLQYIAMSIAAIGAILISLNKKIILKLVRYAEKIRIFQKHVERIERAVELADKTRWRLIFYTVLKTFLFVIQFSILVVGFSGNTDYWNIFLAVNSLYFIKLFLSFASIADLGIREAGAVYFLGFIGVSQAASLNSAFIIFAINILLPSIAGVYFILRTKND